MESCKVSTKYSYLYSPPFHNMRKHVWTTMLPGNEQERPVTGRIPTGYKALDLRSDMTFWKLGLKLFLV